MKKEDFIPFIALVDADNIVRKPDDMSVEDFKKNNFKGQRLGIYKMESGIGYVLSDLAVLTKSLIA